MNVVQDIDTALSVAFLVKLDDQSLGMFTSCQGLGAEVVMETREEGGNNGFVWQLPTKLRYPNITLSRPLSRDTETIAKWFASMANGHKRGATGTIEVMRANGSIIATWGLLDVVPVRWSGPTISADDPRVLTETVEIAHHGFLATGRG
ncbi:phage tail protein [Kribbia dieselivorans]|uniref:phage tail protein n=1 Tax=Kribbia dieselivorans TaxID=331526 RepID=UPI0009FAF699|nr:phage tail protein [Kribbia dieselivorans]